MSVRETLLAAVAALLTNTTPAGANVFRSRVVALTRNELPAIVVKPKAETVDNETRKLAFRNLGIEIEVHVRGDIPDQQADATLVAIHAALMADRTLAGKCAYILETETQWDFADADQSAGMIVMSYDITYVTTFNSLATNAI